MKSRNTLSARQTFAFAGFALAVALTVSSFSYFRAKSALDDSLRRHGRMLLTAMESDAAEHLAEDGSGFDRAFLAKYIEDLTWRDPNVAYAAVIDAGQVILAHSDASRAGKKWEIPPGKGSGSMKIVERLVPFKKGSALVFTIPVSSGDRKLGWLELGMNHDGVDAGLRSLALDISGAGLVVVIASLFVARFLASGFTRGLDRLVATAGELSAGHLRAEAAEEGVEELRALAAAFNTMAANLREVIRQIQESGGKVGEFTGELTAMVQDHATSASQQAASLAEVTATMEELSRTSHQIAGNAEAVKESAGQTVEMAQQGTELVHESVAGMSKIKERVNDIAQKTLFLGEKSHEIGKVMDLIKEIAGEIHLLALNAAIESAAAGEYGRRFAVVASEVRRLAEKTRESTESIRSLVSEIQSATQGSIQATEQGSREVDKWRETINLTAGAFEEIIGMIEKTSEASMQISLATHQQTRANDQVVTGMRMVAEMVAGSAKQMKASSATTVELKEMVGKLTEKAGHFRV
jgi:methyl-accepting chemotaxis protein